MFKGKSLFQIIVRIVLLVIVVFGLGGLLYWATTSNCLQSVGKSPEQALRERAAAFYELRASLGTEDMQREVEKIAGFFEPSIARGAIALEYYRTWIIVKSVKSDEVSIDTVTVSKNGRYGTVLLTYQNEQWVTRWKRINFVWYRTIDPIQLQKQ